MMKQILTDVSEVYEMIGRNELFLQHQGKNPGFVIGINVFIDVTCMKT